MRKLAMLLTMVALFFLATGTVVANPRLHEVTAEIVAVDPETNTLTMVLEDGSTATRPVEGEAVKMLSILKPGDKVAVLCRDNENGEHEAFAGIKIIN